MTTAFSLTTAFFLIFSITKAALGVGTALLLRRRVSSLPPRARSRFVAEWDDGRGLAPDVGAGGGGGGGGGDGVV